MENTMFRAICIGIVGVFLGSFGSVMISRFAAFTLDDIIEGNTDFLRTLRGFVTGRSACDACQHTLGGHDLIPVCSWLSTGGKCRYCKAPLSRVYPALELGNGIIMGLTTWLVLQIPGATVGYAVLWATASWLLYLLLVHDVRTMELHEPVWLVLCAVVLWIVIASPVNTLASAGVWAVGMGLFFLGWYYAARLYVRWKTGAHGEGFGMGDVRLAPLIGALLGLWQAQHTGAASSRDHMEGVSAGLQGFLLFWQYITTAGIVGLVYAGIIALVMKSRKAAGSVAFFPGMIVALWVLMGVIGV